MTNVPNSPVNELDQRVWVDGPAHSGGLQLQIRSEDAEAVRETWLALDERLTGVKATSELIAELEGRVTRRTLYAIQAQLTPAASSPLLHKARTGDARVVLTFAGQAQSYFDDLERLYEIPSARHIISVCAEALSDEIVNGAGLEGLHPFGLDLMTWLQDPSTRPAPERLADAVLSQPLIFVTQIAQLASLERQGLASDRIEEWAVAATGHSQGILPALVAAEGHSLESMAKRAALIARYLVWQGIYMQAAYGRPAGIEKPMVAITGQTRGEVTQALDGLNAVIGLANSPRRFVLSGTPADLELAVERLQGRSKAEHAAFEDGQTARPRPLGIEWLSVSAPYHSPAMADALPRMQDKAAQLGFKSDPASLRIPIIRFETGEVWQGEDLCESQSINPVLWPEAMRGSLAFEPTHVIDAGPGAGVSAVSALCLRGRGVQVIAAATEAGIAQLLDKTPGALEPPMAWSAYAPVVIERPNGQLVLENEFTRRTKRPPIILPGMTPTTVEAPMVAAAANAGYLSELAGGGQVTEAIFRKRADELKSLLNPGEGYVVNTLYLDPYLWGLQVGKDRVVQKLRSEGHPILGVTITAGIPPLDEAIALLASFRSAGMHQNALKVGNDDQIRQVLAIADADDGEFILQVEGGKAGGHHSFDALDELLLTWYARIRRRKNLLLTAGGGIGTAERVQSLLSGQWSTKYGRAPMPVDAVFLGTALMAAKEACTSKQVKQSLVDTAGTELVVGRGQSAGGVRSGLSGLGADIHYVDNHAARTSSFLDSIAGDVALIEANRDKIVDALNKTAKPYFGDVKDMTYAELLSRLIEVMALGSNGHYEDGIWLDVTHRIRYGRTLRRALQRCGFDGALPQDEELNAPNKQLKKLVKQCAALAETMVTPEDVSYFINKVCATPGKPVPFVPIIDANVRRWYCSDSLWQAHDDRYDAEQVLIIPGPEAVSGITQANVPVAELLKDYLGKTLETAPTMGRIETPALVKTAMESTVCLFGTAEKPNPIPAVMAAAPDTATLAPTKAGVRLTIEHALPTRGSEKLVLDFSVDPFHPFPVRAPKNMVERIRDLYQRAMPSEVSIDDERVTAYRRVTSDDGPAQPEQIFFATALPAIMQVLLEPKLGLDPLSLLHLRSEIKQVGTGAGPYTVKTSAPQVSDDQGGRRVRIDAEVRAARTVVAKLSQEFLIRIYEGRIPKAWADTGARSTEVDRSIQLDRENQLFSVTRRAPAELRAFAHISGDLNPIHRDPALAILAGLPNPIVHGQWTAATACALICGQDRYLKHSESRFLAPVNPGAELTFTANVVGRLSGDDIVELEVTADGTPVVSVRAQVAGRKTALIFPGQGSQRRGMGMDAYGRSKAARSIWDAADAHTQAQYGFSLLDIVRNNPKSIDISGDIVRHPDGVLNVTQFTQVALTVLSCAGVAELRENGACADDAWFCGHSVGEYSALSAVTDVLPLNALIDVVYHRGLTMQRFVERDSLGRSEYAMGVIRPNRAGIDGAAATEMVNLVAEKTGLPIYVVNHNVLDRQYAVAGHLEAIAALEKQLLTRASDGSAWVTIPGIDVPFHSPLLVDGVPAFRAVLENCIPKDVDIDRLVGRYVPNLVARPFELSDDFVTAMIDATGYAELSNYRKNPTKHGRAILIELLAWQFASPVRWIESQEYLADEVEQLIEIGPAAAPVLSNMFRSSTRHRDRVPPVLHAARDFDAVIGVGEAPEAAPEPTTQTVSAEKTTPQGDAAPIAAVSVTATGPAVALDDIDWSVGDALKALLALRVGRSIDEITPSESVDGLLGGNSARRNQVLLDLGKEFGAGPVDGAHELPISELSDALTRASGARYRHPGAVLRAAQTQVLGTLGLGKKAALGKLNDAFGLGNGRGEAVLTTLATEADRFTSEADALKAAATDYARREGISLEKASAAAGPAVTVDAGALQAAEDAMRISWLSIARSALKAGGLDPVIVDQAFNEPEPEPIAPTVEAVGRFDAGKHVAFTAIDQWSRADTLEWIHAAKRGENSDITLERLTRSGSEGALEILSYFLTTEGNQSKVGKALKSAHSKIKKSLATPLTWAGQTALITGAGPNSIAESLVKRLLEGGARVIVTTSRPSRERLVRFKSIYRAHAARGSEMHIVPFDQGSFEDIDGLCEWMLASKFETRGAARIQLKKPWLPTLCFPFGAVPAEGDPTTLDADIASTLQVNLIGVERLVGKLAVEIGKRGRSTSPVHIVLPLSPNHGQMGRDGLYAESKIGLETLLLRWEAEYDRWGQYTTICGAKIGWVRGTGLMQGLDRVYKAIEEELGIETYTPTQMADALLNRCSDSVRKKATKKPQVADLTGGFGKAGGLRDMITSALQTAQANLRSPDDDVIDQSLPLNQFEFPQLPTPRADATVDPAGCIAIVGMGEIGPFGNARARWSVEKDQLLSRESALEVAWLCGHIKFDSGEWVDIESGEAIDLNAVADTYDLHDKIGIRENELFDPSRVEAFSEVVLSEDLVFHVPDMALAESFRIQDPEHTQVVAEEDGCRVIRKAGARVRVPRIDPIDRDIAGQLPSGFDPARLGFDSQQLEQIDPVGVFNLLATTDAFRSAGLSPEELWTAIHPARIGCTQGSGIGGMRALRRLYADSVLDQNKQSDVLQETLINVTAAYPGMYVYGGYGSMINPVSACATAAVSVEIAADILGSGKADFVVAGAFDDLSKEGARGFAEMQATISAADRAGKGLDPDQSSRPCDARRGGFVESQGGGTILMCRADKAIEMGLPIYGLVAGAWSAADGLQKSVPAPGPGVASIAAGGMSSPLGEALTKVGLGADDVGVVSLHGTSTDANDLNETKLHARLAMALGRTEGNPLPVIGQKAVTGHAKGGAAAWQLIGLCQALTEGFVPPMHNLQEPDRRLDDRAPLVFPDRGLKYTPGGLKAGILTSLGFGHVGAAVCVAHPNAVLETLTAKELETYAAKRHQRWLYQMRQQYSVLMGQTEYFAGGPEKSINAEEEYSMLLDPEGRIQG